jgi:FKBP-type peptidyl-prolyl cis-trans isomerase SlyD
MKVDKNSFVSINYLIRLGEKDFYPKSGQPEEISFCMGWGVMPPGLEEAILGMEVHDHKVVHLTPEKGYGEINQELIMEVPRAEFDPHAELKPGLIFETLDEENQPVYFIVQETRPETVIIDFNHPLAGKELEVSVTVRQVREATTEDLKEQPPCWEGKEGSHHH